MSGLDLFCAIQHPRDKKDDVMLARTQKSPGERAQRFAEWLGIRIPILLAPMAVHAHRLYRLL
jgi:hypothetical protein